MSTDPTDEVKDDGAVIGNAKPLAPQFSTPQVSDPYPCSGNAVIEPRLEVKPVVVNGCVMVELP